MQVRRQFKKKKWEGNGKPLQHEFLGKSKHEAKYGTLQE